MIAPWKNFKGNDIHEGDKIVHPSGQSGIVVFRAERKTNSDKWLVKYGTGFKSRLCLQIGGKGMAEVIRE